MFALYILAGFVGFMVYIAYKDSKQPTKHQKRKLDEEQFKTIL